MKINVKEWLAMDVSKRFYSIAIAARKNDVSLKRHKKGLQALACE
ncbi:hypothetical protein [Sporosarcina sp. FSL K6-5500]